MKRLLLALAILSAFAVRADDAQLIAIWRSGMRQQIASARPLVTPGDIIFERRDWSLTNSWNRPRWHPIAHRETEGARPHR